MRTMTGALQNLGILLISGLLSGLPGCATSHNGLGDENGDGGGGGGPDMAAGGGGGPRDMHFDADAFWAGDPPPMYCGVDGGPPPMVPGGTPECPDDKNRDGCPCPKPGMTAPCWPGHRANRNLGICKDGVTTCTQDEISQTWGPCVGYVLPEPGATNGAAACECFSSGRWDIANTEPCFAGSPPGADGAVSTVITGHDAMGNPIIMCGSSDPPMLPTQSWSPNTIKADCAGHFRLCYTLKAGDAKNPKASDCTVAKPSCTEADYITAGATQTFPDLPAWVATDAASIACAMQFAATGGYGEMSVVGKSVTCDAVGPKVFARVQYCPFKCSDPKNSMDPDCKNCQAGGGGNF